MEDNEVDIKLMDRVRKGDDSAFEELVSREAIKRLYFPDKK